MLSWYLPLPSMLIFTPRSWSICVNSRLVNWLPWSVLCARLAWTLAQHDYGHAAPITEWLAIAETDPFPEVRNAVVRPEQKQDGDEYEPL